MSHNRANIIKTALITAAVFLYPSCALAEASPGQLNLTLKGGVELVLENNLDITIERVSPQIASSRVQSQRGAFDTDLFGSFKREDSRKPLNASSSVAAGGLNSMKSENYSLDAGLSGKTALGTEFTLEVKDDWSANTLNRFTDQYASFTGVRITQPLLKGFGPGSNERQLNIARKNREISIYKLKQKIMETVARYGLAHWDLLRVKEELGVRTESQRLAEALVEINRKKYEAGASSLLEVTQARAAAASRRDDALVAKKAVREKENAIKLLISNDVYELRDREIVPSPESPLPKTAAGLDESVAKAIAVRPDYLETKAELQKNRIEIRYASSQRFPRVDLEASYGFNGLGTSLSDSFRGIDSNPDWSLGIVFRYPLGNNTATGDLGAARFSADQALLNLKKLEQTIIMNLDAAIKDLKADAERVREARTTVGLTGEALAAEEKKLAAGRSTTYNVLKVQEDLAKALSNEVTAVADYGKALITYCMERGTLLEDLGISLAGDYGEN
ncbi:MAG: TolC family protein [Deltaproteobacteria bacterium]|nr:TolC family protein [Deltaproteobacteria bacterium]